MNLLTDNYAGDFDLLSTPIEGTVLIEAGAGTGKTYTLTAVLLRLIAEQGLSIDRILVVTFTEAATAELKEKIRETIRAACREIEGTPSGDSFLASFAARLTDRELALARLREAVVSFDLAAIYTIHGFCRRLLQDNAFESGSLFEMEVEGDQKDVLRRVVEDFWRSRLYGESPLFISYLLDRSFTPECIASMLAKIPRGPFTRLTPTTEIPDTSKAETRFRDSFDRLKEAWTGSGLETASLLEHSPSLKRNIYHPTSMRDLIREMSRLMEREDPRMGLFSGFVKFTGGKIRSSCKKGMPPPHHPFFDLCETHLKDHSDLEEIFSDKMVGLKSEAFRFADRALRRRKSETGKASFDDLLLDVHDSLNGPGGSAFAGAVRRLFGAVLIDEFQDTDSVQWAIFKKLFHRQGVKLLLIGDPKQAIYGFRGADIYAYMRAAGEADTRYTLRINWRSDPGLLSAVNSLFARGPRPFVLENIPYTPSAPAPRSSVENRQGQIRPFTLWVLAGEGKTALPKTGARSQIAGAVAGEICGLLEAGRLGSARIGDSSLAERHMAVLVRTNNEAMLIQEALRNLDIPSVRHQTGNVFDTREALEVRRLLAALAEPGNSRLLRAAMSTGMLGRNGEDLIVMERDPGRMERWFEDFQRCHEIWHQQGITRMMRFLLSEHGVVPRLMSLPGGERRVTNLFHLLDLLQQASKDRHTPEALIKWLTDRIEGGGPGQEEHLLRLERDRDAVSIVTIHKSKGLEYPVVFCPFCWGESTIRKREPALVFHDPYRDFDLVSDIGEKWQSEHLALAQEETLAENLRLLYVALTRARAGCYLVWGKINGSETSAPAWIFHRPDPPPARDPVKALADRCAPLTWNLLQQEVEAVAAEAEGKITVSRPPGPQTPPVPRERSRPEELACRTFTGLIDNEWRIASFSSIVHGAHSIPDAPDHDGRGPDIVDDAEPVVEPEPFAHMFTFPRGARAGSFLHDLLEHTDFTAVNEPETFRQASSGCERHGFDPKWAETITEMLRNLASTPLDPEIPDLTLSKVCEKDRINELEFLYPLSRITAAVLEDIFAPAGTGTPSKVPETIGRLQFAPVRGYMKGFMDMVFHRNGKFYLVDWKSNYLGETIEDYRGDALDRAMNGGFYHLQYYIYTLALDRYLRMRLRNYRYREHFGGIFYVFLRGINSDRNPLYGIFRDRPPEETISALSSRLLDGNRRRKDS